MKLTAKLPLLVVLSILACTLFVVALALNMTRNSLRAAENDALDNSVHAYADASRLYLEGAQSILEIAARQEESVAFRSPEKQLLLHDLAQSILKDSKAFSYLMLLNPDGTVFLLEPPGLESGLTRRDVAFTDWYQRLMSTGDTVFSQLRISIVTQRPTVVIATPVRGPGGQLVGILAGGLELEELSHIGAAGSEPGLIQRYGYITDDRGLIIAHQASQKYVQEQTDFSSVPPVRAALAGQHGTMQYVSEIDGQEQLGAHEPLPPAGWAVVYAVSAEVAFASLTRLTFGILFIALATIVIASIVGVAMARRFTRPLSNLVDYAKRVGKGEYDAQIEISGRDEVAGVASEIRAMVGDLLQAQEKLLALERLATLGRFSGNISHELRNPLAVIDSSVFYLKTKLKDADGKVHEHLDRIKLGVANSTAIIESLLNLTRMTPPVLNKLDLAAVVRDAVAAAKLPEAVTSRMEFPEGELPVSGDPEQLRMAFKNIIKNAIESMTSGGTLTVTVRAADRGLAEVSFADTGQGIAAEDLKKVFQPLFTRKAKGIGLGLSITREIVEKHGGAIEAMSEPGKGATFVVRLPLHTDKSKDREA